MRVRDGLLYRVITVIVALMQTCGPALAQSSAAVPDAAVPAAMPPAMPAAPGPVLTAPAGPVAVEQPDPPSRVGRLAATRGAVSFHSAGATQWQPAAVNTPVIAGDALWTEPGARATLEIGDTRLVLAPATEVELEILNEQLVSIRQPQGEVFLEVGPLQPGQSLRVLTPRGIVTIGQPGRYGLASGDVDHPTTVSVLAGAVQISGPGLALMVGPNQTATISGTDALTGQLGPLVADGFLRGELLPPPVPAAVTRQALIAPPVVQQMTGGQALLTTGEWAETPQYGAVWYPPVSPGWVPYRQGHWAYIAPWGWTWVDDAPWGFAPFHYGRWAQIGPRWGWIAADPGVVMVGPPVYAPALVSFLGFGAGMGVGLAAGAAVGWIPLGPREAYIPPYRASPYYMRAVNGRFPMQPPPPAFNGWANRAAVTVVPSRAMATSLPLAGRAMAVRPGSYAAARVSPQSPVRPGWNTAGMTPQAAQQLSLPPGAAGGMMHQAAPGPMPAAVPHSGMGPAMLGAAGGAAALGGAAMLSRGGLPPLHPGPVVHPAAPVVAPGPPIAPHPVAPVGAGGAGLLPMGAQSPQALPGPAPGPQAVPTAALLPQALPRPAPVPQALPHAAPPPQALPRAMPVPQAMPHAAPPPQAMPRPMPVQATPPPHPPPQKQCPPGHPVC